MKRRTLTSLIIEALSGSFNGVHVITPRHSSHEPELIGTYIKKELTHTWSKRRQRGIPTKRTSPARKLASKMRMSTMRKSATFRKK